MTVSFKQFEEGDGEVPEEAVALTVGGPATRIATVKLLGRFKGGIGESKNKTKHHVVLS